MEDDPLDEPLPPLAGVAPVWRLVAVFSLLGLLMLLCVVIVLVIALANESSQSFANNMAMAAPAPMAPAAAADAPVAEDVLDSDNPAYPLRQDLRPAGTFPRPGDAEEADERPAPSPRRLFLNDVAVKPAVWTSTDPDGPDRVLVSPDGKYMAYASGTLLMAGDLGAPQPVDDSGPVVPPGFGPMGMAGMRGRRAAWGAAQGPAMPAAAKSRGGDHPRAVLSGWSSDGDRVYWRNAYGSMLIYLPAAGRQETAYAHAEFALPVPLVPGKKQRDTLLAIRTEERPKLAATGAADRDPVELVALEAGVHADRPQIREARADHPAVKAVRGADALQSLAVSPDAGHVAVIVGSAAGDRKALRWRVLVVNLDTGEVVYTSPDAARAAGVCWTGDGKAIVYARSLAPAPPDHAPGTPADACDLFQYDLATKTETRLSRGGGFTSPSVAKNDDGDHLFFLNRTAAGVALEEMSLQKAREFAEQQESEQREKAKAWTDLAEHVWKAADLADPAKVAPTADLLRKLDAAYRGEYGKLMKAEPPAATPAGLDQQRREVAALDLAPATRARLEVILGAVEVPALAGAAPAWSGGTPPVTAVSAENPFTFACNPFRPLKPGEGPSLAEVLYRAEGRRLVLTNDPAAAPEQFKKLADADLARGTELLKQNKGDEADRVLLEMAKRHEGNHFLTVHVGTLLYHHGRKKALAQLLQPLVGQLDERGGALPRDARLYNLLGVVVLDSYLQAQEKPPDKEQMLHPEPFFQEALGSTQKAITAFKNALRCDLDYGPAYINLAQAHQAAGNYAEARLCLRRYLALFPNGEWAADARRRLSTAAGEKGKMPPG